MRSGRSGILRSNAINLKRLEYQGYHLSFAIFLKAIDFKYTLEPFYHLIYHMSRLREI